MEEISFDQIEQIWAHNDKPTQLYIHSAFCKSICKYCAYKGHIYDEALYKKYFFEYLPNQIEKYKHIIDNQRINSIYFGGGTPNTEEDLANLEPTFKLLHGVKFVEKVIELHTGLPISDKTIEVLKRENFTTAILGVQTFDKEKLNVENRICTAQNNLDELIGKFRAAGINTAIDLIAFPDDKDRIINDAELLTSFKNLPDEVTIAPLYGTANYDDIYKFILFMLQHGYEPAFNSLKNIGLRGWRFIRPEKKDEWSDTFFSFGPYQSETNSCPDTAYTSCLGIGSTTNMVKQTYSRVGLNLYYETWDGSNTKYELKKQTSLKQLIINAIENLPDVFPQGSHIDIAINNMPEFNDKMAEGDASIAVNFMIPACITKGLEDEAEKFKSLTVSY
jgi:hypothetical protein